MTEVELKFHLPRSAAPGFGSVAPLAAVPPVRRRLYNIYFDTRDLQLAAHGMALRLRRAGRVWLQTLKAGASGRGGLHTRDEWEYRRPGPALDLALFAGTPLARLEGVERLHAALHPVFEVAFERTTWQLAPAPGCRLEVALDRGEVRSGTRREPICEVEIECLEGDARAAFDVAAQLLDAVPLVPSAVTKAQRGYRLFQRRALTPCKATPPALAPDMTAPAAARAVVGAALEQLQANEAGVLASPDPEFVHQARVALRRLRAALRMFRDVVGGERAQLWRDALGRTAAALGIARDWDVFAGETLPELLRAHGDPGLARRLQARAARARRAARRQARAALAATDHARAVLALGRWLAGLDEDEEAPAGGPLVAFAARLLRKRHRRFLRAAAGLRGLDAPARHRVRIDAKRLRYGIEALAPLFAGARARRYAERLARFQDALGRANDAVTAQRLLAELEPPEPFAAFARGWLAGRAAGDPEALEALVARLARRGRFWRARSREAAEAR